MDSTHASKTPWSDSRRFWWLLSPALPALTLLCLLAFAQGGASAWLWVSLVLFYLVIPALDTLGGEDRSNPPADQVPALQQEHWYRYVVASCVPLQYGVTGVGAWIAATHTLELLDWLGLVLSVGSINGLGINTAHELGHKSPR